MAIDTRAKRVSALLFFFPFPVGTPTVVERMTDCPVYAGIEPSTGVAFIEPDIDTDLLRLVRVKWV